MASGGGMAGSCGGRVVVRQLEYGGMAGSGGGRVWW